MKKSFTLVEILIVVAILGILAAIVLPTLQGHITEAKEAAAKDNLRILRNAIGIYAAQHNGVPPGYPNENPSLSPSGKPFSDQMTGKDKYLNKIPSNPFNGKSMIYFVGNGEDFPAAPFGTNSYGWMYKPATKTIKLNWQDTDSAGATYFDY
jgi:general secretion pathway protein G